MGFDLVNQILVMHAYELNARDLKVLMRMAATALDRPNAKGQPARLYYGGEEPLFLVLYGPNVEMTTERIREVRRTVAKLVKADLIEPQIHKAGNGRRQCFRLKVGKELGGQSPPTLDGEPPPQPGGEPAPHWVGQSPTPRKQQEDGGLTQGPTPIRRRATTDRAREDSEDGIDWTRGHAFLPSDGSENCDGCGWTRDHGLHTIRRSA